MQPDDEHRRWDDPRGQADVHEHVADDEDDDPLPGVDGMKPAVPALLLYRRPFLLECGAVAAIASVDKP